MGFSERLEVAEESQNIRVAAINHAGISLTIWYAIEEQIFSILVHFAYLPRQNIVPLMRRLLEANFELISGYYFGLADDNSLYYMTVASVDAIDLAGFKDLCDRAVAGYWELCADLVKDFQLEQEA